MSIKIPQNIQDLKPYAAGKPITELAREKGLTKIVKLASNENPLGPSPLAIKAVQQALSNLHRYPDPHAYELTQALAQKYHKPPSQWISGSGTDALLAYAVNAFTEPTDEVLTSNGTFIGIYVNVLKLGRKLKLVPLKNYAYDLPAILKAITSKTKLIYLSNPNNPTSSVFTRSEFELFMKYVPKNILVILDEAYAIYVASHLDYPNGLTYSYDNLIVTRTLSKTYGLAGLRVGFAWGPEVLIQNMYKVKLPFEPSYLAQVAVAAALHDNAFVQETVATNQRNLPKLLHTLDQLGIEHTQPTANFFMMILPTEELAAQFCSDCLDQGLIIRHVKAFGIPNGIRINSGTNEETDFACEVIKKVHGQLNKITLRQRI